MDNTYLNIIPYDLKEKLLSYLNIVDILSIGQVDEEFKQLFYSEHFIKRYKQCKYDLSCNFKVDKALLKDLVKNNLHLTLVTAINLNGIYWIDAENLRNFIKRFKQLRFLSLLDTKMGTHKADFNVYNSLENLELLIINITDNVRKLPDRSGDNIKMYAICNQINTQYHHYDYPCMARKIESRLAFCGYVYPSPYTYVDSYFYLNSFTNAVLKKVNMSEFESVIEANIKSDELYYSEYQARKESGMSNPFENFRQSTALHIVREREFKPQEIIFLKGIEVLINLKKLDIDILPYVDSNVLKTIFKGCGMLSFLKIRNKNPHLNLSHIRHAAKLEEFSYEGKSYDFPLDKFLMDVTENDSIEITRLVIEFNTCAKISTDPIKNFLERNPKLILFFLCCELPKKVIDEIQRALNKFQKLPQQVFKAKNPAPHICKYMQQLPLVHADMRNVNYYNIDHSLFKF